MEKFREIAKALMRPKPAGVIFLCMATALALMLGMDRHPADSQGGSGHMKLVPLLQFIHHLQYIHPLQSIQHLQLDVLELRMGLGVRRSILPLKPSLVKELALKLTTMDLKTTTPVLVIMAMILKIPTMV
jgi:hypothetical protein